MNYEHRKHDGSLTIIVVSTFLPNDHGGEVTRDIELIRASDSENRQQIENVEAFRADRNRLAPGLLGALRDRVRHGKNVFEALLEAVRFYSRGQISHALHAVGGECRRNV